MSSFNFVSLDQAAPCDGMRCGTSLREYIENHLDPAVEILMSDDPAVVVAMLDNLYRTEGGSGIDAEAMAAYMDEMKVKK